MRYLFFILLCGLSMSPFAQGHGQCTSCHTQGITDDTAVMASIRHTLPGLCINCHSDRVTAGEHIINVAPLAAHPISLPLVNGMVSCTTCHDPHGKQTAQLRLDAAKLCQDCHNK